MNPVPKSITVNTGDQHTVTKTIDDFFMETRRHIEEFFKGHPIHFQIKSGNVSYQPNVVTDDRVTYLMYRQRVVASVVETRTDFNYVHYDFFRNLEGLEETAPRK